MSKRHFFDFGQPQNGEGRDYALGDAHERPGFRPKSFPEGEGFLVFFGMVGGSAAWGALHHRAVVALGLS